MDGGVTYVTTSGRHLHHPEFVRHGACATLKPTRSDLQYLFSLLCDIQLQPETDQHLLLLVPLHRQYRQFGEVYL